MKFVLFYHSFASCWNHGNAHFLRGVARELIALGHGVTIYEPRDGWSRSNALLEPTGAQSLAQSEALVPGVVLQPYLPERFDAAQAVADADVVLAHEWNEPALIAELGRLRAGAAGFTLLFHDTHHRGVSAPEEIDRFDLEGYDGVLAFGEVLRQLYLRRGWGRSAFTWHEAADTAVFRPHPETPKDSDLVWIGNWGDGERAEELEEFLVQPVRKLALRARIHGVRYPEAVREKLAASGIAYEGWLPNHLAPLAFARARATVHVPRRPYVEALPGIPTIRVFEALACGIPLVSAPWRDDEGLFPAGSFLFVRNGEEMCAALRRVLEDGDFAAEMVQTGLGAIRDRHTCAHRVAELLAIIGQLQGRGFAHHAAVAGEHLGMR